MLLSTLGWNPNSARYFQQYRKQGLIPARVAGEHKHVYLLYSERGELCGQVSGRIRHNARSPHDFPAVGDWVALQLQPGQTQATIQTILPRASRLVRQVSSGRFPERIVAANVDTVFLVHSLDQNVNLRRVEQCLTLAWESGANPVIVLSKADLCPNVQARVADIETVAFGLPIHPISTLTNQGMDQLRPYLGSGQTVACLGPTGVGKSTLIQKLVGNPAPTGETPGENRNGGDQPIIPCQLFPLPDGGVLIDSSDLRALLSADQEETFEDVEALAAMCRFRDCTHQREPGCAVRRALEDGQLNYARFKSYLRHHREAQTLGVEQDDRRNERRREAEKLKQERLIRTSRRMKEQDAE